MEIPYSRTLVGGLPWYSVLVVTGIALAVWLAGREEKRVGLPKDTVVDLALAVVPCGIIGARLYYVLMSWELFAARPISVLYIWEGGLGIYGGVIGGGLAAFVYAGKKKLSFARLADIIAPGLLLAQAIGRWGNYFNMEAYGMQITDARLQFFPLAVYIPAQQNWYAATFFYESMWNLAGFAALWLMRKKQRRAGCLFAWYLLIYGSGRFIIEQLRLDSLYIGSLRASQWLSLVLCAASAFWLLHCAGRLNKGRWQLPSLCVLVWAARWAVLDEPVLYAAAVLLAGSAAAWTVRSNRYACAWLLAALALDCAGLTAACTGWPLEGAAQGIHAAFCSLTFPMGIQALCLSRRNTA